MRIAWLSAPQTLVTLRRAGAGLLLGLAPLALIALAVIVIALPASFTPFLTSFLNGRIILVILIAALCWLIASALAALPLLWWTRTRALGAGLALGFILTCALLAYTIATTDFTGLFV